MTTVSPPVTSVHNNRLAIHPTGEVVDLDDLDACRDAIIRVRKLVDELIEVRRDLSSHIAMVERQQARDERDRLLARIAELEAGHAA